MSDDKTKTTRWLNARNYWLQSAARRILPEHRVTACCRARVPGTNAVEIWGDMARQKARYRHVIRCANVWVCPVCANQITSHRRADVQAVIDHMGKTTLPIMISFTLRHDRDDALSDTLSLLTDAWRYMTAQRGWTTIRKDAPVAGYIKSLEVTWGRSAGWHPHFHVLFFVPPDLCVSRWYDRVRSAWAAAVDTRGGSTDWDHACHMTICDPSNTGIADYVAKWGHEPVQGTMQDYLSTWTPAHELTRGGMVKVGKDDHLTPFGMMEAFLVNGDYGPAYWSKLIRDYADAMKGNRQLTWSRKPDLRALARLDAELSDSEVIQTGDSTYYLLAALNDVEWRAILRADIGGLVLDTASTGNLELMYRIIQDAVQSGQSGLTMSEIPATLKSVAGK